MYLGLAVALATWYNECDITKRAYQILRKEGAARSTVYVKNTEER